MAPAFLIGQMIVPPTEMGNKKEEEGLVESSSDGTLYFKCLKQSVLRILDR